MPGDAALDAWHHEVSDADVGKCPADDDLVVPASRAAAVEVLGRDAAIAQVVTGW